MDITVYKVMKLFKDGRLLSPIYPEEWVVDELKSIDENDIMPLGYMYEYYFRYEILSGFHSLIEKPYIHISYIEKSDIWVIDKTKVFIRSKNHHLFKCIIPKGSIYYLNEFGEVVSNQLIVKKEINYEIR